MRKEIAGDLCPGGSAKKRWRNGRQAGVVMEASFRGTCGTYREEGGRILRIFVLPKIQKEWTRSCLILRNVAGGKSAMKHSPRAARTEQYF